MGCGRCCGGCGWGCGCCPAEPEPKPDPPDRALEVAICLFLASMVLAIGFRPVAAPNPLPAAQGNSEVSGRSR